MAEDTTLEQIIARARRGEPDAVNALFSNAYRELQGLARARLRASPHGPMDTTSLVHESYLRLASAGQLRLEDRPHFIRYAASAMRSVIVDLARKRSTEKHGGGAQQVTLGSDVPGLGTGEEEILRVHDTLDELARLDPRLVQVVEMRYFSGMTELEIAEVLGITERTVRRDWEKARLWLAAALKLK